MKTQPDNTRKKHIAGMAGVVLSLAALIWLMPLSFSPKTSAAQGSWTESVIALPAEGYTLSDDGLTVTVSSAEGLAWLSSVVGGLNGEGGDTMAGKTVVLTAGVDLSAHFWTPIGSEAHPFAGHFQGGNNAITGLTVEAAAGPRGLFGVVTGEGAGVKTWAAMYAAGTFSAPVAGEYTAGLSDVSLTAPAVSAGEETGALCGRATYAYISGCTVSGGSVAGAQHTGGLVGRALSCAMVGCANTAAVNGTGGIAGTFLFDGAYGAAMINCENGGGVTGTPAPAGAVGGLCGLADGYFSGCSNTGTVTVTPPAESDQTTRAAGVSAGGIAGGRADALVLADCENAGAVTSTAPVLSLAGLAGQNADVLSGCVNTGAVGGNALGTAGLCCYSAGADFVIQACENGGTVGAEAFNAQSAGLATAAGPLSAVVRDCAFASGSVFDEAFQGLTTLVMTGCTCPEALPLSALRHPDLSSLTATDCTVPGLCIPTGQAFADPVALDIPGLTITVSGSVSGPLSLSGAGACLTNDGTLGAVTFAAAGGTFQNNTGATGGALTLSAGNAANSGTLSSAVLAGGTTLTNSGTIGPAAGTAVLLEGNGTAFINAAGGVVAGGEGTALSVADGATDALIRNSGILSSAGNSPAVALGGGFTFENGPGATVTATGAGSAALAFGPGAAGDVENMGAVSGSVAAAGLEGGATGTWTNYAGSACTPAMDERDTDYKVTGGGFIARFDSRGGTLVESQSLPAGGHVTPPADPVRTAEPPVIFTGWYGDEELTTLWNFDADTAPEGVGLVTLYAGWAPLQAPVITTQPQGGAYPMGGAPAALSVAATSPDGGALSYQWYTNTAPSVEGATALNTGATCTPATAYTAGTVYYYCLVTATKPAGGGDATAGTVSNFAAVTFRGTSQPDASSTDTAILGISTGGKYLKGNSLGFTVVGAGMGNTSPIPGDTRWLPLSWSTNPSGTWQSAPYTATFPTSAMALGAHSLTVTFVRQVWNGTAWAADASPITTTRTVSYRLVDTADSLDTRGNPATGREEEAPRP